MLWIGATQDIWWLQSFQNLHLQEDDHSWRIFPTYFCSFVTSSNCFKLPSSSLQSLLSSSSSSAPLLQSFILSQQLKHSALQIHLNVRFVSAHLAELLRQTHHHRPFLSLEISSFEEKRNYTRHPSSCPYHKLFLFFFSWTRDGDIWLYAFYVYRVVIPLVWYQYPR